MPRTRLEWVERLAGASMWIAIGASVFVASTGSQWTWVLSGCILALAVVSAVAGIPRRRAGRRLVLRKGDEAVHRPRALAVASRLMPASAGRRWLAEAESVLAEITPARRGAAVRSYLRSAPWLAVTMWAREVLRRGRRGPRRPG
jgi:hypothetical protein